MYIVYGRFVDLWKNEICIFWFDLVICLFFFKSGKNRIFKFTINSKEVWNRLIGKEGYYFKKFIRYIKMVSCCCVYIDVWVLIYLNSKWERRE